MSALERRSVWQEVIRWLEAVDFPDPPVFPPELPPESTPGFWFHAAQIEMSTRHRLSGLIRLRIAGEALEALTPLDSWFFLRRIEWAGQLICEAIDRDIEPSDPLPEVLTWLLIETWEQDGCVGFWKHAERGGEAHPDYL